jgi:hypothetical protein
VKKLLAAAVAAAGLGLLASAPANAAGQLCYDVNVDVNGQAVVQADCVDLPTP